MKNENILEIIKVFLKLGCSAFGGPVAHIAILGGGLLGMILLRFKERRSD
ncbi:MAG TPA: hypothetical protein VI749_07815 [Candidatus Omnitrophota bacterium]|nr:hypothetical protein [Candidatus Omnitrophota bacterium]